MILSYVLLFSLTFWMTKTISSSATCSDGVLNGGEWGVDCGGPCDNLCKIGYSGRCDNMSVASNSKCSKSNPLVPNTGYWLDKGPENCQNYCFKHANQRTKDADPAYDVSGCCEATEYKFTAEGITYSYTNCRYGIGAEVIKTGDNLGVSKAVSCTGFEKDTCFDGDYMTNPFTENICKGHYMDKDRCNHTWAKENCKKTCNYPPCPPANPRRCLDQSGHDAKKISSCHPGFEFCVFKKREEAIERGCPDRYDYAFQLFYMYEIPCLGICIGKPGMSVKDTMCLVCREPGGCKKYQIAQDQPPNSNLPPHHDYHSGDFKVTHLEENEMICFCKTDECNQCEYKKEKCRNTSATFYNPNVTPDRLTGIRDMYLKIELCEGPELCDNQRGEITSQKVPEGESDAPGAKTTTLNIPKGESDAPGAKTTTQSSADRFSIETSLSALYTSCFIFVFKILF